MRRCAKGRSDKSHIADIYAGKHPAVIKSFDDKECFPNWRNQSRRNHINYGVNRLVKEGLEKPLFWAAAYFKISSMNAQIRREKLPVNPI